MSIKKAAEKIKKIADELKTMVMVLVSVPLKINKKGVPEIFDLEGVAPLVKKAEYVVFTGKKVSL